MYCHDQSEPLGFLQAVRFPLFLFCVREVRRNYYPKRGCGPEVGTPVARHVTILYFWWSYPIAAVAADENLETWKHLELRQLTTGT
jgi:hypothetical protein